VDRRTCAERVIEEHSDKESFFMAVAACSESPFRHCNCGIPVVALSWCDNG
jgi:hypothetical protein